MSISHVPFTPQNCNETREGLCSLMSVYLVHEKTSVNTCLNDFLYVRPLHFFLHCSSPGTSGEAEPLFLLLLLPVNLNVFSTSEEVLWNCAISFHLENIEASKLMIRRLKEAPGAGSWEAVRMEHPGWFNSKP